jgi:hypothetical protein
MLVFTVQPTSRATCVCALYKGYPDSRVQTCTADAGTSSSHELARKASIASFDDRRSTTRVQPECRQAKALTSKTTFCNVCLRKPHRSKQMCGDTKPKSNSALNFARLLMFRKGVWTIKVCGLVCQGTVMQNFEQLEARSNLLPTLSGAPDMWKAISRNQTRQPDQTQSQHQQHRNRNTDV